MSLCMSVVARTFYSDGVLEWHLSQSRFLFKSRIPQGHPLRRKRQARVGRLNGSNQIRTVNSIGRTAWGGQRTAKRQKCARTARTPGVGAGVLRFYFLFPHASSSLRVHFFRKHVDIIIANGKGCNHAFAYSRMYLNFCLEALIGWI